MMDDLRQKFDRVERYVGSLAKALAGNNKELESKLKEKIRNKVIQKEVKGRKDDTNDFVEILKDKKTEPDTETIVKAKETSLGVDEWVNDNIETVRAVGGEDFKQELVKTTQADNPNITEKQVESVGKLADLVNKIYNSDGGIENQKDLVFEQKNESVGKIKNTWMDTQGVVGLIKQPPQELKKIETDYQKISNDLEKINLPYQKLDKLASFDRIMHPSDNSEVRRLMNSARSKFRMFDKISKGKFSQVTNNFFNKSIVKVSNGFASTIKNQNASVFVKRTVGALLNDKSEFGGGIRTNLSSGISNGVQNLVTNGASFLKKSSGDMFSKLGIGAKKVLGNGFNKIGSSLIKGLNSAASLSLKASKLAGLKMIVPIIIGVFVLIIGINLLQINSNISGLVPRLEPKEGEEGDGGGGGGRPPKYGEITYAEDGKRIIDCGVGMEADFIRRKHTSRVSPEVLASGVYDEELKAAIGEFFGTRCGVVYAAQYLAYDFKYWVPYYFAGKYPNRGLNPKWGEKIRPDYRGRIYRGLDCSAFKNWALINGYGGKGKHVRTVSFGGDCEKIKSIIEPGDLITLYTPSYHVAVVLAYKGNIIKFAHSGGGSGVSTGLINLCTGRGIDQGMNFEALHHKNYNK